VVRDVQRSSGSGRTTTVGCLSPSRATPSTADSRTGALRQFRERLQPVAWPHVDSSPTTPPSTPLAEEWPEFYIQGDQEDCSETRHYRLWWQRGPTDRHGRDPFFRLAGTLH